jgi:Bacterial HORMA domain family 1
MSYSYTQTETKAFTITHANYLASKMATDLKRIQRFYSSPSDFMIESFENEIAQYLKNGYLKKVTYGFEKDGNWIEPTLIYTASDIETDTNDDPGKVKPGKDVSGASFYSFLEYSDEWYALPQSEKEKFNEGLPIKRTTASSPGISGYLEDDRMYSSGGKALSRSSVRSY